MKRRREKKGERFIIAVDRHTGGQLEPTGGSEIREEEDSRDDGVCLCLFWGRIGLGLNRFDLRSEEERGCEVRFVLGKKSGVDRGA